MPTESRRIHAAVGPSLMDAKVRKCWRRKKRIRDSIIIRSRKLIRIRRFRIRRRW